MAAAGATGYLLNIILRSAFFGAIIGIAIAAAFRRKSMSMMTVAGLLGGALATAAVFQLQMILLRSSIRLKIMNSLRGERVPVCLKCGYDQTGNQSDRCPECGAPVRVPQ